MKLFKLIEKHHVQDSSLIGAIEEVLDSKCRNPQAVEEWKPFKWFPNVQHVRMELSPMDIVFETFGIKRRERNAKMHYKKYKNKPINRYALRQITRLKSAIKSGDNLKYWRMSEFLIKRSRIFFLLALRHVFPKWHRDYPFWRVLNLYKDYVAIAREESVRLDYKRVYIEKANSKWRPLGVPKPEWRIYLHLLNQFLVMRLDQEIQGNQHGFRPGLGTLTAWKDILRNANKYKYIYEFDYKKFFDSLDVCSISKVLEGHEVPEKLINRIEAINSCIPKLTDEDLIDEEYIRTVASRKPKPWIVDPEYRARTWTPGREKPFRDEKLQETESGWARIPVNWSDLIPEGLSLDEYTRRQAEIHTSHLRWFKDLHVDEEWGLIPWSPIGVPQGAPTSPFLSVLTLDAYANDIQDMSIYWVRYADDGVVFMNEPRNIMAETTVGMHFSRIEYSPEKSHWVKYNGEWLRPLKFLGMEFDGQEWRANTRNGSKLIFDKHTLLEALDLMKSEYPTNEFNTEHPDSWLKFTMSEYFGFFMSRMYIGEWNIGLDYVQNFRLKYVKGSWCDSYNKWLNSGNRESEAFFLKKLTGIKLTVFNSTTLCITTALEALKEFEQRNFKQMKHKRAEKFYREPKREDHNISEWQKLTQFFWEQHPVIGASLGQGPLVKGPYSSRRSMHSGVTPTGWKLIICKSWQGCIPIGLLLGILLGYLTDSPTPPSEYVHGIQCLPDSRETIQAMELAIRDASIIPKVLMILGLVTMAISIFLPPPWGYGVEINKSRFAPDIVEPVYGPMTQQQMDIVKWEMSNQALLDNLTISPIGDLWIFPW